ncbi:MAG: NifB/NifX family molybdenum-iron cluster-binding protein [Candidatus Eisenbacteria bacterium]
MKIAISSTGQGLDAEMDPRFGRCQYIIVVDTDTMEFETIENPNIMASGGAGIQSAQLIAEKGVGVVLTGNCGPNAFQTLQAAGIPVCVGVGGTVREAVELYKKGEISPSQAPSVAEKFGSRGGPQVDPGGAQGTPDGQTEPGADDGMGRGMGGGMGRGAGRGMGGGGMGRGTGRGMGRGTGRGMRRGMGMGFGGILSSRIDPGYTGAAGSGDELSDLRGQASDLRTELDRIHQRIDELERNRGK